jgi:FMN-dependent NADH-azoreductase
MNTTAHAAITYLPLQLLYANEAGQVTPYTEQLALLHQSAGGVLPWQPVEAESGRPLWLRVLFGLVGLGAE